MSKVYTDNIEKRTGGTEMAVPATGKWPAANIADDAVGTAQLSATGTASATTFLRGDNAWTAVDTSGIDANKEDIALLAFKTQANGSLARYNLVDQSVDSFEDASGVDASASTDAYINLAGKYYRGGVSVAGAQTAFTTVGANTWTCPIGLTSLDNLLVVAGGGGGGEAQAGGGGAGGAGGLLYTTGYAVTSSVVYDITVGAAGVGQASQGANGGDGGNSVWNVNAEGSGLTQTAVGGGGGGGAPNVGSAGGSGGGGGAYPSSAAGGAATQADSGGGTGFGYAGGAGYAGSANNSQGGGGGGAGAAAANSASNDAADGGVGKDYSAVFGTAVGESGWFAGGGGGGSVNDYRGLGGNGGGGNGSYNGNQTGPMTGHANTGGGAGGTSMHDSAATGYDGGTGVVILKYGSFATYENMILVSNTLTAVDAVTKGDIVLTYTNAAGTAVVNTDLVASISRDNGANYTAVTLVSQGTTGGHTILTAHDVTLGGTDTSQMRWKVVTINQSVSKETRIHAVSLGWS